MVFILSLLLKRRRGRLQNDPIAFFPLFPPNSGKKKQKGKKDQKGKGEGRGTLSNPSPPFSLLDSKKGRGGEVKAEGLLLLGRGKKKGGEKRNCRGGGKREFTRA